MHESLMTTSEAAQLLGISVSALNKAVKRGRIRAEHKGAGRTSARMFNRADVERWKRERSA